MELFDEENAYTESSDQWENYRSLNGIEDERQESLADAMVERRELLRQIAVLLSRTLTAPEEDVVRHYYGLGACRLTIRQLAAARGATTAGVRRLLRSAEEKLRFSDEAIYLWKYLYRS